FREFDERLKKIDTTKLDLEYMQTSEFWDFFSKIVLERQKARELEKVRFILSIFEETICKDRDSRFPIALKEKFLNRLDNLSEYETKFLYDFSCGKFNEKSQKDVNAMGDIFQSMALEELIINGIICKEETWISHIKATIFGGQFIAYIQLLASKEL
ncbi:hypothetical protein, partial [Parachlamydia sp.]